MRGILETEKREKLKDHIARLMIVPESDLCVQCAEAIGG